MTALGMAQTKGIDATNSWTGSESDFGFAWRFVGPSRGTLQADCQTAKRHRDHLHFGDERPY
jgi:hypothetical protein